MPALLQAFMRFFFKHLYTTIAWSYDFVAWVTSMGQWRLWQQAALIDFEPGKLLEIGHGPGHLLVDFKQRGDWVIGVDASPQMTHIASRRLRENRLSVTIVRARAQNLPFPTNQFSGVITTFPSEYILDDETLLSIHRVLDPQGQLVVIGLGRITGKAIYDRFSAWLYRVTGQADHPDDLYRPWLERLEALSFAPRIEIVKQPRAQVLRLIAKKL
jgi:ubiquinone/menaquinone biosynthesis C-methylase UbiE